MELDEFYEGARTITVKVNAKGAKLTVTYDPAAVTRKELRTMTDTQYLARALKSWDLTRGGKPVPITESALDDLPPEFLRTVTGFVRADVEDIPKEKWALSRDGSAPGQTDAEK